MNNADLILLLGYLVSAWSVGFTGGFLLTKWKEAMSHI